MAYMGEYGWSMDNIVRNINGMEYSAEYFSRLWRSGVLGGGQNVWRGNELANGVRRTCVRIFEIFGKSVFRKIADNVFEMVCGIDFFFGNSGGEIAVGE